jgi:hypothetical protein
MRILMWHVDHFAAEPTERGRSKVADAAPPTVSVEDALVIFVQAEKSDEPDPETLADRTADAIGQVAAQLKVATIVLHSFAHLFGELAAPAVARQILDTIQARLEARRFAVHQTAFGWFNRLDLRAKGHPYSRQARQL